MLGGQVRLIFIVYNNNNISCIDEDASSPRYRRRVSIVKSSLFSVYTTAIIMIIVITRDRVSNTQSSKFVNPTVCILILLLYYYTYRFICGTKYYIRNNTKITMQLLGRADFRRESQHSDIK